MILISKILVYIKYGMVIKISDFQNYSKNFPDFYKNKKTALLLF